MSGTNLPDGLAVRETYSGSTAATDTSNLSASTKFIRRTAVIRCDAQTSETETGFTFPDTAICHSVKLNVVTIDATETVDVGTGGTSNDPNGFLAAASLATAGLVKGTLANGGQTLGALMYVDESGGGVLVPEASIAVGGDPVTYTCSAGSDTAIFDIIIDYTEVVEEVN